MRVLSICRAGVCRSVAASRIFKFEYGYDALACGWERNSTKTINMLCAWADKICVMHEDTKRSVLPEFHFKTYVLPVGHDVWENSIHPELQALLKPMIAECVESWG